SGAGDVADADHRVRLGLSLRSGHQHRGRGDQPAAEKAGAERRLQDPDNRARGGLRGEGRLMSTLRQKLTVWYTAAVLATLTAFGATLYIDRRVSTGIGRASCREEVDV